MPVSNEDVPLGERIKAVGLLAGIVGWVVTMGVGLVFLTCLAVMFLAVIGVIIWMAWAIHWVVGLGVTFVFVGTCAGFANNKGT